MTEPRVILTWDDNNNIETGYRIYRSNTSMNINSMPDPITTLGMNVTEYTDLDVIEGNQYYYMVSAYTPSDEKFSEEILTVATIPMVTGPGPQEIIAGTAMNGFFGEVSTADLINGVDLSASIGLTNGTNINIDEPWLKFAHQGRILFIAKKILRSSIPWNAISTPVPITIGNNNYSSRIIYDNNDYSEWNDLIYKVHIDDPTGSNWWNYQNADMDIGLSLSGRATYVYPVTNRYRGYRSLTELSTSTSPNGWRPVLELTV